MLPPLSPALPQRLTSDEVEAKLTDVLLVLKYVQNKDVFMRYHKAHLTRRLILDTNADSEKEENMVEWLREVRLRLLLLLLPATAPLMNSSAPPAPC